MGEPVSPVSKPTRKLVPLFPLEAVLLPCMPLPMQVRDERFRALINRCVRRRQSYGVLLVRGGQEAGPTAETCTVGTLARIRAIRDIDGNCMNLLALGTERFRLLDRSVHKDGYLVGHVEMVVDAAPVQSEAIDLLREQVLDLFGDYFQALVEAAGVDLPEYDLPQDAVSLSFVVAAVLQMPVEDRQVLLEMTSTEKRLTAELSILNRQIGLLNDMPSRRMRRATRLDIRSWMDELSRN